ncbi:MAG TPA: hypothetical protein VJT31_23405, partial [Rugosimonospora sp.]|nr:hypothetical protein [Rugosimonospora sp.]
SWSGIRPAPRRPDGSREGVKVAVAIGTTAKTGEHCPESGVWKVIGTPSTTAPISKGETMPPYGGKAVTWQLIQFA